MKTLDNLTAKERRLFDYLVECEEEGYQPTVGDICRECRTTVLTLYKKTWPGLERKMNTNLSMNE